MVTILIVSVSHITCYYINKLLIDNTSKRLYGYFSQEILLEFDDSLFVHVSIDFYGLSISEHIQNDFARIEALILPNKLKGLLILFRGQPCTMNTKPSLQRKN